MTAPTSTGPTTLLVLAKRPRPGHVKTRLTPAYTEVEAAQLAAAALADTLAVVAATPARRRVLVLDGACSGGEAPSGFEVRRQVHGPLDARIAAAIGDVTGPVLLVGMDTPQLTPALLQVSWRRHDAWLGLAADGGFWALGLAEPEPEPGAVRGVPMSRPDTGAVVLARLQAAGLRVGLLPVLRDVDTPGDAAEVAAAAPWTRFAATHAALGPRPVPGPLAVAAPAPLTGAAPS